jgi:hypothetical protein
MELSSGHREISGRCEPSAGAALTIPRRVDVRISQTSFETDAAQEDRARSSWLGRAVGTGEILGDIMEPLHETGWDVLSPEK